MKTMRQGLKEARALKKYKLAIHIHRKDEAEHYLDIALNKDTNILMSSFLWSETKEGHAFWKCIDYKLNNYFRDGSN